MRRWTSDTTHSEIYPHVSIVNEKENAHSKFVNILIIQVL